MKRAMVGMVVFTMGVWVLSAQGSLVADWQFNDATSGTSPCTAADSSGNGITLSGPNDAGNLTSGMNWTSGQSGGTNGAMHFTDGGHASTINAGYLWNTVARHLGYSGGTVIAKIKWSGPGGGLNCIYSSKLSVTGRQSFYIDTDGSLLYQDEYWSNPVASISSAAGVVPVGEWAKIQVAWDNSTDTAKIWVNDHQVAASNTFHSAFNYDVVDAMAVGALAWCVAYAPQETRTFNGDIDSVQYYDEYMVPEPMSLGLLAMGGMVLFGRRK